MGGLGWGGLQGQGDEVGSKRQTYGGGGRDLEKDWVGWGKRNIMGGKRGEPLAQMREVTAPTGIKVGH